MAVHRSRVLVASSWGLVLVGVAGGCILSGVAGTTGTADEYTLALQRVRSRMCEGLSWNVGTCGDLRFITESTGFTATVTFYDPDTGQNLGQEFTSDILTDGKPTSDIDCGPRVVEESGLCGVDLP